jgi:hypothetical protein
MEKQYGRLGLVIGLLLLGSRASAGDPPGSEALPPPRPVEPPAVVAPAPPVYRLYAPPLSRDVWNVYDVDHKGFWRPRVAFTPYGDYYLRDGTPFYGAELYPHWFRQRVRGD